MAPMMPRWQRVYLAVCAGAIVWCLSYVAVDYTRIPRVFHFQHEHRFELRERVSDPVPAGYIGLWLAAALAGVGCAVIVYLATRFFRREARSRTLDLSLA